MLDLQKSLTYFTTSLRSNYIVTEKLLRLRSTNQSAHLIKLYEEDEDLLEDVIIEYFKQHDGSVRLHHQQQPEPCNEVSGIRNDYTGHTNHHRRLMGHERTRAAFRQPVRISCNRRHLASGCRGYRLLAVETPYVLRSSNEQNFSGAEQLLAGIILADNDNREYIYLPGGEVGSEDPHCIFEKNGERAGDLPLEEAVELAKRLHLSPGRHPELGSRAW